MPFQKGHKKIGGKEKGTENKTTEGIKQAYQMLIENNLDNLTEWLERVAMTNPAQAISIINDLSEYVIPKLARKELTGKDGKTIIVKIEND